MNKSVTVHCDNKGAVAAIIKFGVFSGFPNHAHA